MSGPTCIKQTTLKNTTYLVIFLCLLFPFPVIAQVKRCVTQEKMQEILSNDPQAKIRFETTKRMLDDKVKLFLKNTSSPLQRTSAIINVPVVVHIMFDN